MNVSAFRLLLVCVLVALGIFADDAAPSTLAPLADAPAFGAGGDLPDDELAADFDLDDSDDDDDDDGDDEMLTSAHPPLGIPSRRHAFPAAAVTSHPSAPLALLFRPPQRTAVL